MGQDNTKKTLLNSMKKGILFCFLCVLLLCLFIKWPSELKTLAANHPSTFFCSSSISSSNSSNISSISSSNSSNISSSSSSNSSCSCSSSNNSSSNINSSSSSNSSCSCSNSSSNINSSSSSSSNNSNSSCSCSNSSSNINSSSSSSSNNSNSSCSCSNSSCSCSSSNINSSSSSSNNSNSSCSCSNSSCRNMTTILLWYWPFRKSYSLQGDVCWDLYRIPCCRLVDQRSLFSSADVVVFHNRELLEGHQKLPLDLQRPQHQRWAWMSLESPLHNGNLRRYAGIFNITITYRRDADVSSPYGELIPKETEEHVAEDAALNKSSLVCWVVSDYLTHHKRSEVYRELKAVVPVKVYGHWTKAYLTSGALLPTISRCYFYLAFENSIAKDYITEKLWRNAYQGGAVPVVLGPSLNDYKTIAPPHSFIHVDEFASVKDLGKYLQQLAEDKKRYSEYFTWKQQWKVKLYTDWRERLCKICSQYNSFPQQKYYTDLEAWVNANNI